MEKVRTHEVPGSGYVMPEERVSHSIEQLLEQDGSGQQSYLREIRKEIGQLPRRSVRASFILRLWITCREERDLDDAIRLGRGIEDARIKDDFLADLVDALLAQGRYGLAGAQARVIHSPSLRTKTLGEISEYIAEQRKIKFRREATLAIAAAAKKRSVVPAWRQAEAVALES